MIKFIKNLNAPSHPNQSPPDSSPSILMCTWIWQCHVNLIKLNEWRRRRDEKTSRSSINKQKSSLKVSIREISIEKCLKQENRVSERQRKMKWKLISFKNKIKCKRDCRFFAAAAAAGLDWFGDWMWLWKILKISRFIESLILSVENEQIIDKVEKVWWEKVGGWEKSEKERTENHPCCYFELFASLYRIFLFDWRVDWLIDSFCLEIAWWIDGLCTHFSPVSSLVS